MLKNLSDFCVRFLRVPYRLEEIEIIGHKILRPPSDFKICNPRGGGGYNIPATYLSNHVLDGERDST